MPHSLNAERRGRCLCGMTSCSFVASPKAVARDVTSHSNLGIETNFF